LVNKKRLVQAGAFCFMMIVIAAFSVQLYFMDDWVGGVLLWNSHEAYVFSSWSGMGFHFTTAGFLVTLLPAYFGLSGPPDDSRHATTVFHITSTGIEKYVVPDVAFRAYIARDNVIYAWDGGPLWKWAGNHFELATQYEEETIIETPRLTVVTAAKDLSDPNGWSVKNALTSWPPKAQVDLSGKKIDFLMTLSDLNRKVTLDVQLPERPKERILHAESRLHLVSRSEYKRRFPEEQRTDGSP
jgi:hypothetical protein